MDIINCTWGLMITNLFIAFLLMVFGLIVLAPFILVLWFSGLFVLKTIFIIIEYLEELWYKILRKFNKEDKNEI